MTSDQPSAADRGKRGTVYIDCTGTWFSTRNTGVQRVVRNIAIHAAEAGATSGWTVRFVVFETDRYVAVEAATEFQARAEQPLSDQPKAKKPSRLKRRWSRLVGRVAAGHRRLRQMVRTGPFAGHLGHRFPLSPDALSTAGAGDILLQAEVLGDDREAFERIDGFSARGGVVAQVVFDLIPLTHPETYSSKFVRLYKARLDAACRKAHVFLGISKAVQTEIEAYVTRTIERSTPAAFEHFRLGSGLDLARAISPVSAAATTAGTAGTHRFLVVGTLEPRKRHGLVLDAFERYWAAGGTAALIIVGAVTWRNEALLTRLDTHPERDRRLVVLRAASDADLDHLYRSSTALVFASVAEGFGLPIVEAATRGLPAICTDLPVLREVARPDTRFFPADDVAALAAQIDAVCQEPPAARIATPWLTWSDSARELFAALDRAYADLPRTAQDGGSEPREKHSRHSG